MYFKGQKYNIPIQIWIVEMYPHHPPICYVTPAPNMMIKPQHKHVDSSGRCYLPYLSDWNTKSNLFDLVNILSTIFGNDPPCYEKQTNTNNSFYQTSQNNYSSSQSFYSTSNNYQTQQQTSYQTQQNQPVQSYNTNTTQNTQKSFFGIPSLFGPSNEEKVTQKIKTKLETFNKDLSSKSEDALSLQTALQDKSKMLDNYLNQSKMEIVSIQKTVEEKRKLDEETSKWLEENQDKEIDIDKIINASDEQSQQILELVSNDHAIEDAMYYLDKQLEKGGIEIDTYLYNIRELSKKQFLSKALLRKIAAMKSQ